VCGVARGAWLVQECRRPDLLPGGQARARYGVDRDGEGLAEGWGEASKWLKLLKAPLAQLNRESCRRRGKQGSVDPASLAKSGQIPSNRGGTVAANSGSPRLFPRLAIARRATGTRIRSLRKSRRAIRHAAPPGDDGLMPEGIRLAVAVIRAGHPDPRLALAWRLCDVVDPVVVAEAAPSATENVR
jgi:hypothetical protein